MTQQQYVSVSRQEGDEEEETWDDEPVRDEVDPNTKLASTHLLFRVAVTSILCGALLGAGCLAFLTRNVSSTTVASTNVVSYGFLQTQKGKDLLQELSTKLLEESPQAALDDLALKMQRDEQIASSCHPVTHRLGRLAFDKFGFKGALESLMTDTRRLLTCNAAYMHGVIEHSMGNSKLEVQEDIEVINNFLCSNLTDSLSKWECNHGVGHGIIQRFRREEYTLALKEGVDACQHAGSPSVCENGLWMDHFASTQVAGELEPSSLGICEALASSRSRGDCVMYAPTEFLLHYPRQYTAAIEFCNEGLQGYFANTCVSGVGMQTFKENIQDLGLVEQVCIFAPSNQRDLCFRGALNYYSFAMGGKKLPASMCEKLVTFRKNCLDIAG